MFALGPLVGSAFIQTCRLSSMDKSAFLINGEREKVVEVVVERWGETKMPELF